MSTLQKTKADEFELVAAIKAGSFEKNKYVKLLISDHQGYIYKLRTETGLDESVLKDIYTDTVLLILQHIENDTFRGDSRLSTYFYKIFYFKTVDYIRQNASSRIEYTDELPEHSDETQNITQIVEAKDEMNLIIKLLDKMCSPCREIIMDWAYWGFKPDEIGQRIGETDPVKYSKIKYNCIDKFKKLWHKRTAAM
ncbi:RNA polymerase sigma factor [Dyadobacter psychrotolerans]|uniref:Sigma-70 family RNA polymerase sigma factor n=1 Tax=Dyadobacter psychrotolerans TaxID=2541721 RepID=A0A4R5DP23_9BACT|nr:sigma-70 family RNA polymerase sigma factor [Dyadobacter psychrotolerans]TDE15317.1 sigma-70 family RNA polymerase sigma factor [Dyadobacter psychrotolerans]